MFKNYVSRREYKRRYDAIRQENIAMIMRTWDLEGIALDAQFVLECNRITKYPEIAEDIIDRVDDLRIGIWATEPDDTEA
jgi:hypothetical protein